jgi:Flp pilus assembly protein TadB
MWIMALACGGALLLILVLPLIGVSKYWAAGIAVAVMIGLHVWMMRGHSDHSHHKGQKRGAK